MITRISDPRLSPEKIECLYRKLWDNSSYHADTGCVTYDLLRHNAYGRLETSYNGEQVKLMAHIFLYEYINGPLAPGTLLRHTCDNPPCFVLDHMIAGTHIENMADMVERGRSARGERVAGAKLTEPIVRDILTAIDAGATLTSIGQMFNVDRATVSRIRSGKSWRHIERKEVAN